MSLDIDRITFTEMFLDDLRGSAERCYINKIRLLFGLALVGFKEPGNSDSDISDSYTGMGIANFGVPG